MLTSSHSSLILLNSGTEFHFLKQRTEKKGIALIKAAENYRILLFRHLNSNLHPYTLWTVLTLQCKKYWRDGDQSYIPKQLTRQSSFNGFSPISCRVRKSYSKSLLQRRNVSSWYFSRHKSSPGWCANRGSLSRAEKILFLRCKKWHDTVNLQLLANQVNVLLG